MYRLALLAVPESQESPFVQELGPEKIASYLCIALASTPRDCGKPGCHLESTSSHKPPLHRVLSCAYDVTYNLGVRIFELCDIQETG